MAETDKAAVSQVLRDIARLLELKGTSAFKVRAYDLGADRISALTTDLRTLIDEGKLAGLPGIGKSLEEKITQYVRTGSLPLYDELTAEFPPTLLQLLQLPDLGPKRAAVLYKELGVATLDDLEKACVEQRVRKVKTFAAKTEERILEAIRAFRARPDLSERMLLAQALPVADRLLMGLAQMPGVIRSNVAGSLRRFSETVGDIDLVASSKTPLPILEAFAKDPEVAQVIGQGESKCSVKLKEGMQVDLRVLPDEDYATALHHFTGSKAHHIRLRGRAQDKGLRLSEWGAFDANETKRAIPTEEALYAMLGMQYVPPELREDWGEFEAAIAGTLPTEAQLVSTSAIRGAVHNHSTWSDGKNSLEEMALAAKEGGLEYLTVTEHSETASYAGGLKPDDLQRQWDEIDALNERLAPFRLLKGIEADILQDGSLDYSHDILSRLEVVIGSIHVRHSMDEAQMTLRILNALDHPYLHILGHMTGRLIRSRPPYALRVDEIFEKAARNGVVIEVNGSPERLDLKAEHVHRALRQGVRLVCSVDAHATSQLGHIRYAVATARKGWARKEDVLNTRSAEGFLEMLRALRANGGRAS